MPRIVFPILVVLGLLTLLAGCGREAEQATDDLLQHVPAETPYVYAAGRHLPQALRDRLGDHFAAQLSVQRAGLTRLREQVAAAEEAAPLAHRAQPLFAVLDALFAEFEGRDTAAAMRELGIEPVTRSVVYGIGLLPAARVEIADAARLNALLDRVEQRAGVSASRAELGTQSYRRIDLGEIDAVLAVTEGHLIAGLLTDALFDRHLPLLLGQEAPATSLAQSGAIAALIERYGFTGHGEGFIRLDDLVATLLGKGEGLNAEVMQAVGGTPAAISPACMGMTEQLVGGMPRIVTGISEADERRLAARAVWESGPEVAAYLQRLAAPVPGVGEAYDGLLAVGMGLDLPRLRSAIDALLRELIATGTGCEWVDPQALQAIIPQLNLALGPMTAGIKGFNLLIDDLEIDPATLEPRGVRAGLVAAVDDPRGVFALAAMFNPALASLEIPTDGTLVALPQQLGPAQQTPPLQVAIKDKALLLVAGEGAADMAGPLLDAATVSPMPMLAIDYGIRALVERLGDVMERAALQMNAGGEAEMAGQLRAQVAEFRQQAQIFERLRLSVHASEEGLVMDQVMELR